MRFAERVVVVTGGGSGIGRATALAFAQEGATVAILGRRIEPLRSVEQESGGGPGQMLPFQVDVTEPEAVDDAIQHIAASCGGIDVLVNNAGSVPGWTPIHETSLEIWKSSLETNLTGAFTLARATLPHLIARNGSIVNVSSISASKAANSVASYAVAKAGLLAFTRCIAAEYGWQGVRCNSVVPSWVETEMTAGFLEDSETRRNVAGRHALQRVAEPGEIARVILHLASDDASFVTGMEYLVDGGMRAL